MEQQNWSNLVSGSLGSLLNLESAMENMDNLLNLELAVDNMNTVGSTDSHGRHGWPMLAEILTHATSEWDHI